MKNAIFLVIEGLDGAGKSTLIEKCIKTFLFKHLQVDELIFTRSPGGTPFSEKIRNLFLDVDIAKNLNEIEELLLIYSSHSQNIRYNILPALQDKKFIVCDRFVWSTLAYHLGGRRGNKDHVDYLHKLICGDIIPSLTIYLDIQPQQALSRLRSGKKLLNRIDLEDLEFFQRVRDKFLDIISTADHPVLYLDSNNKSEVIFSATQQALHKLLFTSF